MALIKDGYWQDTYCASRYWQEDYWPEYGTYVPPAAPPPTAGIIPIQHRAPLSFIHLLHDYVETLEA